ncbi:unnamed protein product, partial [marine sediment metagenome]
MGLQSKKKSIERAIVTLFSILLVLQRIYRIGIKIDIFIFSG